jgi:hypothetical protein
MLKLKIKSYLFICVNIIVLIGCLVKKHTNESKVDVHHTYRDLDELIVPIDSLIIIQDTVKSDGDVTVFDVNHNCWDCTYIHSVLNLNSSNTLFDKFSTAIDSGAFLIVKYDAFLYYQKRAYMNWQDINIHEESTSFFNSKIDSISSVFYSSESKYPLIQENITFQLRGVSFIRFKIHSTLIYDNFSAFVLDSGYYDVLAPLPMHNPVKN